MNLFAAIVLLPAAPLRGLVGVAQAVKKEVDRQLYDPATARGQLEELDRAEAAGRLSGQDKARMQEQIINRMVGRDEPAAGTAAHGGRPA